MRNPFRSMIVVAAVVLAALVAAPACQCESEESKKPTKHVIAVEPDDEDATYKWRPIKPIEMRNDDLIQIDVGEHTVWILIPTTRFKLIDGGSDWVVTTSFTAFKVENGSATIQLEGCDPNVEPTEEMHYSVLVRRATDAPDRWDYVHGKNPPPRMIIPPRKR